jgi:alpha-amylase/alpha-mannosidase (GH57 family)
MTSSSPVLSVCFLWHMHQPIYKSPFDENYLLPWVRLHAVKDYLDMALLIEAVPGMKAVINMVPSLLVQIQEYADGSAIDRFLLCSQKPADRLSEEDKSFLLQNFFMVYRERKIAPSPRYSELLQKRGEESLSFAEAAKGFTDQDYLDLQVHFNLAWCGPSLRKNAGISKLIGKDSGFTEEEKQQLLSNQKGILRQIIPTLRRLQQQGQIEISFSPFFHPILPLLCDTDEARRAKPAVHLPENRFQFPEDAEDQIRMAAEFHETLWGQPPQGMWPSEGAVSNQTLDAAIRQGVRWVATDQAILQRSLTPRGAALPPLSPEDLYTNYDYHNSAGRISLFFRNQILSDLIGFTYSSWEERRAAENFFTKLLEEKNRLSHSDHHILSIIMDGENAWEYFPEGGEVFLTTLYQKIVASDQLQPLTFSEFLDRQNRNPSPILPSVSPGTWIQADFSTWIGEPAKNKAWDCLYHARKTLQEWIDGLSTEEKNEKKETIKKAMRAIHTAEGSDSFWWLREGERPPQERIFDDLMKLYLIQMYKTIGREVPQQLKIHRGERD